MAERRSADVVVVGAGPAGIAAAVHAAEAGARTLLLDAGAHGGGQIWRHRGTPPAAARPWLERLERCAATHLRQAAVIDVAGERSLLVEQDGHALRVDWQRLVLATGARERFLPFPGWTLAGVLGAGAAQALLKAGGRFEGSRVVVAGSGPLLLAVAAALSQAGARVVGIVEQAPLARLLGFAAGLWSRPAKLIEGLGYRLATFRAPFEAGAWVTRAEGREGVERVRVSDGHREWSWECDVLACGYGLVPSLELPRLLGCAEDERGLVLDDAQQTSLPGVFACGELGGIGGLDQALVTGAIAGLSAAGRPLPETLRRARESERRFARALEDAYALREELRSLADPTTLVCRCEDVARGQLDPAWCSRQAKLYTRAGMGPCQSRVCGPALGFLFGWGPDAVRPPLEPTALSTLEDET